MSPSLHRIVLLVTALSLTAAARADNGAGKPVSFYNDVRPLLASNCNACHKPDKMKAELDMTTYAALMKGGKHGHAVVPGDPGKSRLIESVSGDEPDMPKDADPLKADQVSLLTRWIKEGAKDDTPPPGTLKVEPPVYTVPPAITSLAFSPDGSLLAVSGYHEVLLHKGDGSGLVARLVGEAPRVESIAFSKDGRLLAVAGGAPAEFGQVQIWDAQTHKNLKTFQPSTDSLYGISFAPDGKSVACGAADKVVRRLSVEDGKVLTDFRAHADWVLATLFTLDGKTIVSGGRDQAMKLIDVETGRFVDDINNPLEQILCMARHPTEEQVLYGGDLGVPRIYRISDNQGRTAGRNDTNLLVTFERQPGPVSAVAFSPDGKQVAVGSVGEVRVYDSKGLAPKAGMAAGPDAYKPVDPNAVQKGSKDGKGPRSTTAQLVLSGHAGPVFAVAWKPDGSVIATAGFDGKVRLFDAKTGNLVKQFVPVPLSKEKSPETRPAAAVAR